MRCGQFTFPVCAVAQRFGAIPPMVCLTKPALSPAGEPVMIRTATLVAITLLSALATPVVVNATTLKPVAVTIAAPKAEEATCARPVRVVYAGYGEGQGAACPVLVR